MKLSDLPWPDVVGGKVIVVTGAMEQHGPHLPLNTDVLIAEAVAARVAEKVGAMVGPTIPVGISSEHIGFPGTVTLDADTFKGIVLEIIDCLRKHGYREVIVINGHGGNNAALEEMELDAKVVNLTELMHPYDHAGEIETSLILHLHEELVRKDEIKKQEFSWPGKKQWKDTKDFSKSGVLGDPTQATGDKGQKYLERLVAASIEELRH